MFVVGRHVSKVPTTVIRACPLFDRLPQTSRNLLCEIAFGFSGSRCAGLDQAATPRATLVRHPQHARTWRSMPLQYVAARQSLAIAECLSSHTQALSRNVQRENAHLRAQNKREMYAVRADSGARHAENALSPRPAPRDTFLRWLPIVARQLGLDQV